MSFRSGCITNETASIDSPVVTGSGIAEATYTANGCTPTDTVTASIDGVQASASVVLNIESADADRIISQEPEFTSIAPSGSGSSSRQSESTVGFQVVDKGGAAVPNVKVNFSISGDTTSPATPVTIDPPYATSDSKGEVTTLVIAGSDSTVIRVVAEIETADGGFGGTQSPPIAINSTIPIETGLTLAASNLLPDAQFTADTQVNFTVLATDKNGQNIRGNTTINFTATGGSITPECPLDQNGSCTVAWRSQAPWLTKPQITATTIGELTAGGVGTISQTGELFVSSSKSPSVTLAAGTKPNQYCASVAVSDRDEGRIHPPEGTEVAFAITNGEILSAEATQTVRGDSYPEDEAQFVACVFAEKIDNSEPARLTATVTTPGETIAEDLITL